MLEREKQRKEMQKLLIQNKHTLKFILCLLIGSFGELPRANSQTYHYDVVKGNKTLGGMTVVKTTTDSTTSYYVESDVEIKILLTFKIYYELEEIFHHDALVDGNAFNTFNDKMQKQSVVKGDGTRYVVNLNGELHQINESKITYSIPQLYYEEPKHQQKIFSQQFATFLDIINTSPGVYEIESPDGKNIYKYNQDGVCVEVKVSRTFATFYFRLRSS